MMTLREELENKGFVLCVFHPNGGQLSARQLITSVVLTRLLPHRAFRMLHFTISVIR